MLETVLKTDDTAQRILNAAEQVFAEKGFRLATVREILERAGVRNIAAVNYYFGDKENLYVTAVKSAYRDCVKQVAFPEWTQNTPPEKKLRDFVHTLLKRILLSENPWSHRLMLRELVEPTRACLELVQEYVRPMHELLQAILAELLPEVPTERRVLIGYSIFGQILVYRTHQEFIRQLMGLSAIAEIDVAALADHIAQFSLAGIESVRTGASNVPD